MAMKTMTGRIESLRRRLEITEAEAERVRAEAAALANQQVLFADIEPHRVQRAAELRVRAASSAAIAEQLRIEIARLEAGLQVTP